MKKILLLISIIALLAAGCGNNEQLVSASDPINLDRVEEAVKIDETDIIKLRNEELLVNALLKSLQDNEGELVIDSSIRYYFNKFCNDYVMWYMPNVDDYEFEYPGAAIYYLFSVWNEYGRFPEKLSQESIDLSLSKAFSDNPEKLRKIEHKTYLKYAKFEDGYYSLPATGAVDSAMVYNLLDISMEEVAEGFMLSATIDEYSIDTTDFYERGEQELLLIEKADQLGLSLDTTLMYLLEKNEIDIFEARKRLEIEILIDSSMKAHIMMFNDGEETYRLD